MTSSVVRLGAWCDVAPPGCTSPTPGAVSFVVGEFAVLADGRRLVLHEERGFTTSAHQVGNPARLDTWTTLTRESVEDDVRNVVLPDDDSTGEEHDYGWLSDLLRRHGVDAPPDVLRSLPYTVELSAQVEQRLGDRG